MKSIAWVLGGLALGAVYIHVIGILTIQVAALRGGAVLNLNNVVVAVTRAHEPYLQIAAIAVLSTVTVFLLAVFGRAEPARRWRPFVVGFIVAMIVLIPLAFVVDPLYGPDGSLFHGPTRTGWPGWLGHGGRSSAVHVVFLLSIALLWFYPRTRKSAMR